ncbi:MAG: serine--tRNA ligase [candidate division Zixibacteria bacterium]|nr:serine--tRNA ligase [candidate division Zixibacteria bacterium]
MLDLKFIRENPDLVRQAIANKNEADKLDELLALDGRRRDIIGEVEALKHQKNVASENVAKTKKAGGDASDAILAMRAVSDKAQALDESLRVVEEQILQLQLRIPNIPNSDVPVGDESANQELRYWGEKPSLAFKPAPHWELGETLGIYDGAAGANVSGSGFFVLKGAGAKMQRALVSFMLDRHTAHGYLEHRLPYLVTARTMQGTGQLPKLAEDMYHIEADDLYLIPTAEVPLTNLSAGAIISADLLPQKAVAYTPCFRRESGAHGKDTRGMLRVHQFDKVELVKVVEPEHSYDELELLLADAEAILQALRLPYRVKLLATGDLSFAAAKCYDLEVYSAGVDTWLEVSSCSNFVDFQARRMNLRARPKGGGKPFFPHTLNGSGLALPRTMIAIWENYQTAKGSIMVPEILVPYMGGQTEIS